MKVLLLFPPVTLKERYSKDMKDDEEIGGHLPPLGLLYLSAILKERGIDVKLIDATASALDESDILESIGKESPDIIGISTLTPTFQRIKEMAKKIKLEFPDTPIVMGGPHVSIFPSETLEENSYIDYIVFGEGEYTLLELVETLKGRGDFSKIKGLAYREEGVVKKNEARDIIKDLDSLPFPARDLLEMEKYSPLPNNYKQLPLTNMLVSRGCPFHCSFCCKAIVGRVYRIRSVENVIAEIKELREKYNIKEVAFWDDVFTVKRKWVLEFCDRLKEEGIDISWTCESRVNLVDLELLKKMKEAGCWNIFYGIESGDQQLLDNIDKGIKVEQIRNAVKWAKEAGLEIRGSFMLGLPGETPELARKTIQFAIDLDVDYAQFSVTTPFPGTKLYDDADKFGTLTRDFDRYTEWNPVFIPHAYKNEEELEKIHREAYRRFYIRPSYFLKRISKINSLGELKRLYKGFNFLTGLFK
jgi:radical SAM superfamily enzyme YgiQ (UPF0313 family)